MEQYDRKLDRYWRTVLRAAAERQSGRYDLLPFDLTGYTLTVTVNGLGDGGIITRENPSHTGDVVLILGGEGYGQGARGGNAGNSIYWADSLNPSATFNIVPGVFIPGDAYNITVTAVGNTFSAYINGSTTPVTTFTDSAAGSDGGVGLYDDQPNMTTGSGFGTPTTFSNFNLTGTTTAAVPEPTTVFLVGSALAWIVLRKHRTKHC